MTHDQTTLDVPSLRAEPVRAACLVCIEGPTRGVYELPKDETISIGRSRSSEICVDDPAVSRLHATFRWDGDARVLVTDHESRNGTRIGAIRVQGESAASNGDVVHVGPASLMVLVPGPRKSSAAHSMQKTLLLVDRASRCDLSVLLLGETGVGKEVLARRIHEQSARARGPFVALHCGAIPETLAESVLFGHEKGAFTGADARREGVLESATGGTVFLDEIGELRPSNQVRLLRALEERKVTRVGGTRPSPIDVRLIAATHRDLDRAVADGSFRRDLLYRLDVLRITVPPLRDRTDELPELVRALAAEVAPGKTLTEDALIPLSRHTFPGNVRELRNLLARAAALGEGSHIDREAIESLLPKLTRNDGPLRGKVDDAERAAIEDALAATQGNQTRAAARLGISRRGLIYKMERYGLKRRG
ncbi:MAG: sigma 54-interacting transcriptional regulator [Sandaracinus sp.]